jgi:hypothetical protein
LEALGHAPGSVLAAAGIEARLLDDPDATVPMSAGVTFLAEAARRTGDPNVGLHLAERALDTELDVTTTVRFHPLELVVGVLPGIPIVVALGLVPWALVLYEALDVAVTL